VSVSLDDLKRDAAQLSETERAELALSLIQSLEAWADDSEVEEAWRLEIERRVDEVERGKVELIPGDEVFAELRQRLG
jgi:putative addiction module component (TIGR02574 family)